MIVLKITGIFKILINREYRKVPKIHKRSKTRTIKNKKIKRDCASSRENNWIIGEFRGRLQEGYRAIPRGKSSERRA